MLRPRKRKDQEMKTTIKTEYYDNGQKMYEGSYKGGKREGLFTEWYENEQKMYEGNYRDGKVNGVWSHWYENGQKKEEGNYSDGKVNGVWSHWNENGQKEEVNYKDGKEDGLRILWHKDGQKKLEEVNYKDGKEDGLRTLWYENGQKKLEEHYKGGRVDGSWNAWHENGQKRDEVHYIDMRKQSIMASTWEEYLCIERVSQNTRYDKKKFELSIRSYEVLGEIVDFQDEEGNLNLPDEIEGKFIVGSWEENVIGGNLIPRSDEYGQVRFTDFQHKDVSDWLDLANWNSNKIRKELKKLSKLEKHLQKTIKLWSGFLVGPRSSGAWNRYGWGVAWSSIAKYIFEYTSSRGEFPRGIHQIENLGGGRKTVNFDSARQHFEDDPIEEFMSIDSSSEIPSTSSEDNEIYYPATDYELESHKGHKSKEFIFRGSLIDGLEVDLLELSGLELTYSDVDKIWGDINCRDLLAELDCVEIELCETDEIPGQSDSYYEYQCGDKGQFIKKLRAWIIKFLEDSP